MITDGLQALLGVRTTTSEADTIALASELARTLPRPALVLLAGDLGAGKTRFAKGLAVGMGIDPARVSSPTFTLMHEHEAPAGGSLVHVDAYRLDPDDEHDPTVEAVTDRLFARGAGTLCVIEWPSRITDYIESLGFTGPIVRVSMDHAGLTDRRIEIEIDR